MITEEGIKKFIDQYEAKYGIRLERQEAFDALQRLIGLVKFAFTEEQCL